MRGFVTIATGSEKYYKLALQLLYSYRTHCSDTVPFGIICDRTNKYTEKFDEIVVVEHPNYSYMDKLLLYKYSPFEESIFIDADSLILADLKDIWDDFDDMDDVSCYGVSLPLDSDKGWFTYQTCGEYKNKISFLIDLHGGIYYFRKTERCKEIFEQAIKLSKEYSKYGFRNFSSPADEPVMAMSMAICRCHPCEKKMRVLFIPSYYGKVKTNYEGQLYVDREKRKEEICHFGTDNTELFLYKFLAYIEEYKYLYKEGKNSFRKEYFLLRVKTLPWNGKAFARHMIGKMLRKILPTDIVDNIKKVVR